MIDLINGWLDSDEASKVLKSLKFSLANYIDHIKNPSLENTFKMCLAANFSGKAISISKTTAPHALSYPFTSYFGINHGHAVSLTFNDFLKFSVIKLAVPSAVLRAIFPVNPSVIITSISPFIIWFPSI